MRSTEFADVIRARRTCREWSKEDVEYDRIVRIISAGMKAPTWDHYRNWQFVVLRTREEKEKAFAYAKKVAEGFDAHRYDGKRMSPAMEMYGYAMPLQYSMLVEAPYVIVPLFRCRKLNAEWVSKLNPLSGAWCVVENMLLAATDEGLACSIRIPLNKEHDIVKEALEVPDGWMIPCFIGVGHPKEGAFYPRQYSDDPQTKIHSGKW